MTQLLTRRTWFARLFAPARAVSRPYHRVTCERLSRPSPTHVEVTGLVTYVRKQADGDWHVTIEERGHLAVLEIIPPIPIDVPRKGQRVRAFGISRVDFAHKWGEVHPVERLEVLR